MREYYWDNKIDYLLKSRFLYFNDDYIEFLIKAVWKITQPVDIIDFGCGTGSVGEKFLPYLPAGSKYTGIDKGHKLIAVAQENLQKYHDCTEFIINDINFFAPQRQYDIAICQTLLMHLPNPREILQKMIRCVKKQGVVICIEPHWNAAMANFYIHELEDTNTFALGVLQKLFHNDARATGKDGNIGIKIPVYLQQLGLSEIQCRISDCVRYCNPAAPLADRNKILSLLQEEGFAQLRRKKRGVVENLVKRGLSKAESLRQFKREQNLAENLIKNGLQYNILFGPALMITSGRVPGQQIPVTAIC